MPDPAPLAAAPHSHSHEGALIRALVRLVLIAAIVTAPIFLFGEGFEARYVGRVAASNGLCVALCLGLLALLRQGRTALTASILIYGLLALVGTLAWINGEPVHVNVVNFTLVVVLASAVGTRRDLVWTGALAAAEMTAIAWTRPAEHLGEVGNADGPDLTELRFEGLVQFLPTFLVIVGVLWLVRGAERVGRRS